MVLSTSEQELIKWADKLGIEALNLEEVKTVLENGNTANSA